MRTTKNKSGGILLLLIMGLVLVFAITPSRKNTQPASHNSSRQAHQINREQQQVVAANRQINKPIKTVQVQRGSQQVALQPAGTAYLASRQQAIVGLYGGRETDNPADNILMVTIDRELQPTDRVWLNYRLAGVADHSGVACSVNDRLAFGGYLVKTDTAIRRQRVQLNAVWLRKGNNRIQFSLPANATYGYKVSDLAIEVETNALGTEELVVNSSRKRYDGKVYVHGFVTGTKNAKLNIDGSAVTLRDGEFEYLATADTILNITAKVGKQELTRTLHLKQNLTPDHVFGLQSDIQTENSTFRKNKSNTLQTELALLKAPAKVTLNTVKLSSTTLRGIDLPAMDMGMTNVTSENRGVRFLPHGQHFGGEGATVALKYDRTKIPDGYTENDIRTYYFDTNTNHWVALERDTVNKELCMVVSKTTHFTDMINGVIKTPESPETQGFAPTMMNDIKAADPTAKIEMIAPPSANNQGSANLSYPIELPPARNGMSPNLAISYNSDGGSGWLGEGWDLSVPSITVDTRWGVPRYDDNYETETYKMNGTTLATVVNPTGNPDSTGQVSVQHRGTLYERNKEGSKQFYPIVENEFSRIIRYKNKTSEYIWGVTDKNGINYWYGAQTNPSDVSNYEESIQSTVSGNVMSTQIIKNENAKKIEERPGVRTEWKLREVIDPHKSFYRYNYENYPDTLANNIITTNKKLESIDVGYYNGNGSSDLINYKIKFISNSLKTKRTNNARYGFITTDNKFLLDSILIYCDTTTQGSANQRNVSVLLRSYAFSYKETKIGEKLLIKIQQFDNEKNLISFQDFDYHDKLGNDNVSELFENTNKKVYANTQSTSNPYIIGTTALSLGNGTTSSFGGSFYAGLGATFFGIASAEAGYEHGFNSTESQRQLMFIDVNGDGLPDKIFRDILTGKVYFCSNLTDKFSEPYELDGAPASFMRTYTKTVSDGWRAEAGVGKDGIGVGVNCGMDWSKTDSYTTAYMADVNNDGLVDIVNNGVVSFNVLEIKNGIKIPSFKSNSLNTKNPIVNIKTKIGTSTPIACEKPIARPALKLETEEILRIKNTPLQDVVRFWEAPYSGTISIEGTIKMVKSILESMGEEGNVNADGVRLQIQINNNIIRNIDLNFDKYSDIPIDGNGSINATIAKGDIVYFRLKSGKGVLSNGENDLVVLKPVITYTNRDDVDIFTSAGYESHIYKPSDASMMDYLGYNQIDTVTPDAAGKCYVKIGGYLKKPVTNANLTLKIYSSNEQYLLIDSLKKVNNSDSTYIKKTQIANPGYQPKKLLTTMILPTSEYNGNFDAYCIIRRKDVDKDVFDLNIPAIYNSKTQYWFEISSVTNEKWNEIEWKPEIRYMCNNKDTVQFAGVKYNLFNKKLNNGSSRLAIGTWKENITSKQWFDTDDEVNSISFPGEGSINVNCEIDITSNGTSNVNNKPYRYEIRNKDGGIVYGFNGSISSNKIKFQKTFYSNYNELIATVLIDDTLNNCSANVITNTFTFEKILYSCNGCDNCTWKDVPYDWCFWGPKIKKISATFNNQNQVDIYCRRTDKESVLGSMWRGWGQFQYNPSIKVVRDVNGNVVDCDVSRFSNAINPDSLYIPTTREQTENPFMFRLKPEPGSKNSLFGQQEHIYIKGDTVSTGRLNIQLSPIITENINTNTSSGTTGTAMRKVRFTGNSTYTEIQNENTANTYGVYNVIQIDDERYVVKDDEENEQYFVGKRYLRTDDDCNPILSSEQPAGNEPGQTVPVQITDEANPELYTYITAPILSSSSESEAFWGGASASIGVLSSGISGSKSDGTNKTTSAFTDMNGDGYPDYITDNQIEYTNIRGSRDGEIITTAGNTNLRAEFSVNNSKSIGFSRGYGSTSNVTGHDKMASTAQSATNLAKDPGAGFSFGVSSVTNTDYSTNSYIDVNGDGLPDRIYYEGGKYKVCLNLGFNFSQPLDYGINKIQEGQTISTTYSGTISGTDELEKSLFKSSKGVESGKLSFGVSYGINKTQSTTSTLFTLRDINGDGLVDQILWGLDNEQKVQYKVKFNQGNRFSEAVEIKGLNFINDVISQAASANLSASISIPIFFVKVTLAGSLNMGTTDDFIKNNIQDINGDGHPDLLEVKENGLIEARLSKIGCTGKLKSVSNMLGGVFSIDYARSAPTVEHPGGKWVMTQVMVNDGVADDGDNINNSFEYAEGVYDRYEREFLGFAQVKTNNLIPAANNSTIVYRTITQKFDNSNNYTRANLLSTVVSTKDINGASQQVSSDKTVYYTYAVKRYVKPSGNTKLKLEETTFNNFFEDIVRRQHIIYSPAKFKENKFYSYSESRSDSLTASQSLFYYNTSMGSKGELTGYKFSDKGGLKLDGSGYTYRTATDYDRRGYYLPVKHTVYDANEKVLRQSFAVWDTLYSNHLLQTKSLIKNNDTAIVKMQYDKYGNIIHKLLPSGMAYTYTYDGKYNMYVTQVKDTFGYTYRIPEYDYRFGIPLKTIDINGNAMTQRVDNRGRIVKVTGPNEYNASDTSKYTIKFEYHPGAKNSNNKPMPYAITRHYDPANTVNDIETVSFADGFGRAIQVKKDGFVNGQPVTIVGGRVKFDAFGRTIESYYPGVETDAGVKYTFNPTFNDQGLKTTTTYDVLDRVLTTTLPDKSSTYMNYCIENNLLKTTVTDALGHKSDSYADGSGNKVKMVQHHNDSLLTTTFEYDAVNQPVLITDTKGNKTSHIYDLAGRCTSTMHPASGTTNFGYDAAGNLIWKYTANKDSIRYGYEFNRMKSVSYPRHPENNVNMVYGDANADKNRRGRLVYQEDGSGGQEFWYGNQGELIKTRRTLVIPNQAVATYDTKWQYDSWNRLQTMTYPDGEEVNYSYDIGGQLNKVSNNQNYTYVSNIVYDKFGERTQMVYGNSAVTNYTYNDSTRNLKTLSVTGVDSKLFMNNVYTFDKARNVKYINNLSVATENGIGGSTTHSYGYDDLYRLTKADGTFAGDGTKSGEYHMTMDYDNMYNPISKKLQLKQYGTQFNDSLNTGYNLSYTIAGNYQQISNIAENSYRTERMINKKETPSVHEYSYDANGNQLTVLSGTMQGDKMQATNSRKMLWDEDNHLLAVSDNGFVSNYWYDAAGERTVKLTSDGEGVYVNGVISGARTGTSNFTVYVDPYTVINNGGQMSKHIYVGVERILAKLCDAGSMADPTKDTTACAKNFTAKYTELTSKVKERFDSLGVAYHGKDYAGVGYYKASTGTTTSGLYYFHSDHLGSASLITDGAGHLNQYLAYIPNGEVFINQQLNSYDSRYKFSAKEMDAETGLYYFSQRYMDPKYLGFLSVDPLALKKPWMSSYNYCSNNPTNRIDPDGRYDTENINGNQQYKVIAVFQSNYLEVDKKQGNNAIATDIEAAQKAGMPIMFVDNMKDYANAMKGLKNMGSSTETYALNSHGRDGKFFIGSDAVTKTTNFSMFKSGLSDKTVFIGACNVTSGSDGQSLIQKFSQQTSSTIIGADHYLNAGYGYAGSSGLNGTGVVGEQFIANSVAGIFGGNVGNSFHISSNGSSASQIYNVTINKNSGMNWNSGNQSLYQRLYQGVLNSYVGFENGVSRMLYNSIPGY